MLKAILASLFTPLVFWSLVLALAFSYTGPFRLKPKELGQKAAQVQENKIRPEGSRSGRTSVSTVLVQIPAAAVFLTLLQTAAQLPQVQAIQGSVKDVSASAQNSAGTGTTQDHERASSRMAFVSVRTSDDAAGEGVGAMIPCRLVVPLSNARDGSKVVIRGVVTDNIAGSSGKIVIEAGTKVLGVGHIDALTGRIKSYGIWTLVTASHSLRARARLLEYAGGRDGVRGEETSPEPPALQKQAIIRDGIYLYVPDQHEFTLELLGQFRLEDFRRPRIDPVRGKPRPSGRGKDSAGGSFGPGV
jgi:hypothetical protein